MCSLCVYVFQNVTQRENLCVSKCNAKTQRETNLKLLHAYSLKKIFRRKMKIIKVANKDEKKDFLNVVEIIYKDDKNYIRPLDKQMESIFSEKENAFFSHGELERWILKDDDSNLIGRVAAFINEKKAFTFDQPTGGIGFFECINDEKAAVLLFDTAKKWLEERKIEAMDGPINFGENDNFWGLLIEGFTPPGYGMQYNPPYYKDFFENYGFKQYFKQVTNHLNLRKKFPERFWKIAKWVMSKKEYKFVPFSFKEKDKFVKDFVHIYNSAWKFHENFQEMTIKTLEKSFKKAKAIIEEDLIWFVYHGDEPVAFLFMVPDINQIIKKFNGKLNLWNKIRFYYLFKTKKVINRGRVIIMGVAPKYQRYGLESGIFWCLNEVMQKKRKYYEEIELSWVGDFNPKMEALHKSVGGVFGKKHITYRCIFDKTKEHKRSSIIPTDTKYK